MRQRRHVSPLALTSLQRDAEHMVAAQPIGQMSVAVFLGSMSFPPKAPSDKTGPSWLGKTIMRVVVVGSGPMGGAVAKMDDGTWQAIDQLVRTRRSIRRFTSRPVSKTLLHELLDVAGRTPSNSNMQPWRLYMVGGAAKDKLAHALSEAHEKSPADYQPERPMFAADLPAPYSDRRQLFGRVFYGALGIDRADKEARARYIARNLIFYDAPIAAFFTVDRRLEVGSWFDCGLLAQTFMLAARARGLDTCAQVFLTKYHSVVRRHLPH